MQKITIMKHFILSLAISFITIAAMTQTILIHEAANYEAANWKTWL